MTSTVRITSEHVGSPQFQGQSIRAVGMLVAVDAGAGKVQLQLAGEGAPRDYFFSSIASQHDQTPAAARAAWPLSPPSARTLRPSHALSAAFLTAPS